MTPISSDALTFLREILSVYTPSGEEHKLIPFYLSFLREKGFRIVESKTGNVIGIIGKGNPVLLLSSHLDTVAPELPYREDEKFIYARGAVDCKSSWAAMLYSTAEYYEKYGPPDYTIILAGIVGEEIGLYGIKALFNELPLTPDCAIFGEPTGISRICIGYRGRVLCKFTVKGESGHSSTPWNYKNAILITFDLWKRISEILNKRQVYSGDGYFNRITYTPTFISGGRLDNIIPEQCNFTVDIRIPPGISPEEIRNEINGASEKTAAAYATEIQFQTPSLIPAVEISGNEPIIGALRWAIMKTTERKAALLRKTGTTFMNLIVQHYGIPTIVYGPGDPKLEHTSAEKINKEEYLKAIEIYMNFFQKFPTLWRRAKLRTEQKKRYKIERKEFD